MCHVSSIKQWTKAAANNSYSIIGLQMLDPTQLDIQDELSEAQLLAQQQLSIQVGLLGLAIKTSPGEQ
jgi:hypothetical protein